MFPVSKTHGDFLAWVHLTEQALAHDPNVSLVVALTTLERLVRRLAVLSHCNRAFAEKTKISRPQAFTALKKCGIPQLAKTVGHPRYGVNNFSAALTLATNPYTLEQMQQWRNALVHGESLLRASDQPFAPVRAWAAVRAASQQSVKPVWHATSVYAWQRAPNLPKSRA